MEGSSLSFFIVFRFSGSELFDFKHQNKWDWAYVL